jgi:hypothetical protein
MGLFFILVALHHEQGIHCENENVSLNSSYQFQSTIN